MVNTKTGALDPEQIEKTVSFPIETEMSGIAKAKEVRSLSKYGLSQVVIVFEDGADIYWARQQVSERLQGVRGDIPPGLSPELAPITTGLGEVLMYAVLPEPNSDLAAKPEKERLLYLRTIQDFVIAPYLKRSIKNAAEVDSTGGYKKEIHIELYPERLDQYGLSIEHIAERLDALGENIGGGYIQPQGRQVIVRVSGYVSSLDEIRNLPVKLDVRGRPVLLSQVADVRDGYSQRVGGATYDGEETVLGTVLMLSGANSRQVALDAEQALKDAPLPPGVKLASVQPELSCQCDLENCGQTGRRSRTGGCRAPSDFGKYKSRALRVVAIPLSMLFGAVGMRWMNVSASLMSLGAIDFGLLVDGAVVMIENTLRRLEEHKGELRPQDRLAFILDSAVEVVKPVTLGLAIIMLVYVPILTLEGIEGKLYHPMAITVLIALGASLLVAVLLMPVLAYLFLTPPHGGGKEEKWVYQRLHNIYEPVLSASLKRPILISATGVILIVSAFYGLSQNRERTSCRPGRRRPARQYDAGFGHRSGRIA